MTDIEYLDEALRWLHKARTKREEVDLYDEAGRLMLDAAVCVLDARALLAKRCV